MWRCHMIRVCLPTDDPPGLTGLGREDASDDVLCLRALLEADDSATEPCMPPEPTFTP